jgi:hypothetical protein
MRQPGTNTALAFVTGWLLVSGGLALAIAPRATGPDQAALLDNGRRILAGQIPFRDILDINSPIVFYLNTVPAAFAAATGTNPIPWFTALIALLSAWSALLADRALLAMSPKAHWVERLALMLVPLGPATVHLTMAEPGQRDHLYVLMYFPFLIYRVAAAQGTQVGSTAGRFILGAVAAVGVGVKPYFLVPTVCAEAALFIIARRRRRLLLSPEVAGALVAGVTCAVALLFLPADARRNLFEQILPLVNAYAGGSAWSAAVVAGAGLHLAVAALAAAVAWRAGPSSLRPAVIPLTAFCLGGIISAIVQGKGFGYHYIPANAALSCLAAAAVLGLARGRAAAPVRAALAVAISIVVCIWRPLAADSMSQPDPDSFGRVLAPYTRSGDSVMVMSTIHVFPPILQMDRILVGRQSAFMLRLALHADATAGSGSVQTGRVLQEIADDIRKIQPAAVFLDRREMPFSTSPGFHHVAEFLQADPGIRRALESYQYAGESHEFDVFLKRAGG